MGVGHLILSLAGRRFTALVACGVYPWAAATVGAIGVSIAAAGATALESEVRS